MQKDKSSQNLKRILDIKEGTPMPRTTEKSAFNMDLERNRPTHTFYVKGRRGRMLTQREMGMLRRWEQIWPNDVQRDADRIRLI